MKNIVTLYTKEKDIANVARRGIFDLITDYLTSVMGEDAVSRVGCSEISVSAGHAMVDGYATEICVNIAPVVKDWKGNADRPPYNREEEAEAFRKEECFRLQQRIETKKRRIAKIKAELAELERLKEDMELESVSIDED